MARINRFTLCMILVFILTASFAHPLTAMERQVDIISNQYTQADIVNPDWETYQDIPEPFQLLGENSLFELYANLETLAFKVVDKRSGYVWHSNLDEKIEGDRLNKTWTAFAQSGISIDYLDDKAVTKRLSITNSEHTLEAKPIDHGFEATISFTDVSIALKLIVQLESNGVLVSVPFESIQQEDPDHKLGALYIYPFMGATRDDTVPGYMFIPDGPGSLIRFASQTKAKNMFYGRYYGADLGMITEIPFDWKVNRPQRLLLPVYGMVHGYKQNAFISIVEKGASFGELQAHPSGVITNFNFLYNTFIYNQSYFQATNRSGAGVTTIQKTTNAFDVVMHYRFLTQDEGDYVGMAKSYQQYLVDLGALKKVDDSDKDIGIRLEFLGGEKERVLFWDRSIPMTTIDQMDAILADLAITNLEVVYYGWQPMGASSMPPKVFKIERSLGTIQQLSSLVEDLHSSGSNFYLYLDPQAALMYEGGYSPRYDLAMSITNSNLVGYNRYKVNYYFNTQAVSERYTPLCKEAANQLKAGLALDGVGSILYSDFKNDEIVNREAAITHYQEMLAGQECPTAFYVPNNYVFGYLVAYYDIPLTNNGYIYTTDLVPFLQVVLSGYVPYYGPVMNFSSNMQEDLLRMVDFGVYPSYYLTHERTAEILTTSSNWIYTSSYEQWSEEVKQTHQWMNDLLSPVKGEQITARKVIQNGVVATSYANGKQIIINYTNNPFTMDGITVEGKDAVLVEALP